jgi:hypothetical protein
VPYGVYGGVYGIAADTGRVDAGTGHGTAWFAAGSIRRWWNSAGQAACPAAGRLLISAGAGGSSGCRTRTRTRTRKTERAASAAGSGPAVTVRRFPPGTPVGDRRGDALRLRPHAPGPGFLRLRSGPGQLLGATAMTTGRAKQEVRPLLEAHGPSHRRLHRPLPHTGRRGGSVQPAVQLAPTELHRRLDRPQ